MQPIPDGALLKITRQGKMLESFDYQNGKVIRVNTYGSCDTPYSIVEYNYSNELLESLKRSSRETYMLGPGALCDPDGKVVTYDCQFEYDSQGRIQKTVAGGSYTTFEYKNDEVIMRFFGNGITPTTDSLKYDERGNLIERRAPNPVNGGMLRYEYDNHINPLRNLHNDDGFVPADCGPNNIIRVRNASNEVVLEYKYTYDANGRVKSRTENGQVYDYHYQGQ